MRPPWILFRVGTLPTQLSVKKNNVLFSRGFVLRVHEDLMPSDKSDRLVVRMGILIAGGIRIWGSVSLSQNSPKIMCVTKQKVVLKVPGHGKLVCKMPAN
jgi:hypothetical protein